MSRTVAGPAGRLHVKEEGEGGTAVLFVHGFAGSSDQWSGQLAYFGGSRRVIALDLRGHGSSAGPTGGDYSVAGFAADVGAVADSLGLQRLVLVGHSLGGAAAIEYAGRHPARVAGLILIATPGKVPSERAAGLVAAMEKDYDRVAEEYWERLLTGAQPDVRARVLADRGRVTQEAGLAIIRTIMEYDPLPALDRYPGPKLLITTSVEDQPGDLAALRPDLPRRTITGTSHWPQMDNPAEINRLLDEFLGTVP